MRSGNPYTTSYDESSPEAEAEVGSWVSRLRDFRIVPLQDTKCERRSKSSSETRRSRGTRTDGGEDDEKASKDGADWTILVSIDEDEEGVDAEIAPHW